MQSPAHQKSPDTQGQLRGLATSLRGVARCLDAIPGGEGIEAVILRTLLDRAGQDLAATAWKLERQAAGRPALPERGEADPREEGWPEIAGALRDLEARLGRRSLLVEDEPEEELGAAVAEAAARVKAAIRACR